MEELEQKLLNEYIVLMSVAAWFITWVLQKVLPVINTNKHLRQLKPLLAPILCQGFVWIPGAVEDGTTIGEHILIGFWCGFLAAFGYQLAKRILGARGVTLPDDPAQLDKANGAKAEEPGDKASESEEDADDSEEKTEEKESSGRPTPKETPIPKRYDEESKPATEVAAGSVADAPTIVPQGTPVPVSTEQPGAETPATPTGNNPDPTK